MRKGAGGDAVLERKEDDPEGLWEREPRCTGDAGVGGDEEGSEDGGWYDLARETTWKPAWVLPSEWDDGAVEGGDGEFVRLVQVVEGGECASASSTPASESEHEDRIISRSQQREGECERRKKTKKLVLVTEIFQLSLN